MAIIDYADVRSLRYAKLTPSAKALIPVLATLADNVTGQLSKNDSKINTLKTYAGLSRTATRAALRKLKKSKIISLEHSQGQTAEITYLPIAHFTANSPDPNLTNEWSRHSHSLVKLENEKNAVDPRHDTPESERQLPCSLNTVLNTKTTTGPALSKMLIKEMIAKHGSSVVVSIISGMEKMQKDDPQAIQNPGAYFRTCCEENWIPTSKAIQEKKLLQESREKARAAQDTADLEHEKRRQTIEAERNDPETMKRIEAYQLSFTEMTTPSHSDHGAVSGHARPKKQF